MAKLDVFVANETCDWCNKLGNRANPVFVLLVKIKGEKHVISVHRSCVQKRMDKAEAQYET